MTAIPIGAGLFGPYPGIVTAEKLTLNGSRSFILTDPFLSVIVERPYSVGVIEETMWLLLFIITAVAISWLHPLGHSHYPGQLSKQDYDLR